MNLTLLCLLSFLATACTSHPSLGEETVFVAHLSPAKQRHRLAHLKKKLEWAERELESQQEKIARLHEEIDEVQLLLIRREIDHYEEVAQKEKRKKEERSEQEESSSLFIAEREALLKIIEGGPTVAALEAQRELDRILRVITEMRR